MLGTICPHADPKIQNQNRNQNQTKSEPSSKSCPKNPGPSRYRELSALHSTSPSKEGHGQIFRLPANLLASGPLPSGIGQLTAKIYYGNL